MAEERIPVTIVNHAAIDIAAPPETLWQAILEDYIQGAKFAQDGYVIERSDEPSAIFGGYRVRLEKDGALLDDRIIHVTERDDAARRLSLRADYLTVPGGLQVYVTYQAHDVGEGARYTLDCHTRMELEAPADAGASLAATVAETRSQFDAYLAAGFERVKARLEEQAGR